MRIAGGKWRGRVLFAPEGLALRPTQDAVREALFSMLAAVLPGARFLDLYAGTGAVGLEALSRGAATATWVEQSPRSLAALRRNLGACAGGDADACGRVASCDVRRWVKRPTDPGPYDIVFADPPYVEREGEADDLGDLLADLAASALLLPDAIVILEQRDRTPVPEHAAFEKICTRRYGKTQLSLYRKVCPEDEVEA